MKMDCFAIIGAECMAIKEDLLDKNGGCLEDACPFYKPRAMRDTHANIRGELVPYEHQGKHTEE